MHWMFLPLKRYAEFHGRSTRTEYWMFALFQFLVMFVVMAITIPVLMSTGGKRDMEDRALWLIVPIGIFTLGLLIPNIAVTVDLLTTGIDVPKIANLVFLRRVGSRILYEQMIGRATRLCTDIGKERFRIFDAVDLYSALKDVTDMKPVVVNPFVTFEQLVKEVVEGREEEFRRTSLEEFLAKLQRKKRASRQSTHWPTRRATSTMAARRHSWLRPQRNWPPGAN